MQLKYFNEELKLLKLKNEKMLKSVAKLAASILI